ncbi:MAG TPA: prepilin-type N-terminal cleavage/methylation domain-containing protein [Candidatus Limnocylindria bacterium]|nr:prepilin-type N-terminal cleavage/methylation domain-containing protein [Candidatus Limnocylindria bacterium]
MRWSGHDRRTGRYGFTLIELLLVVGLSAIMMAIAIPVFRAAKRSPLAQATEDFSEACREARAQAVFKSMPMQLVIRGGGGEILVEPAPVGVMGATNGVSMSSFEPRVGSNADDTPGPQFHATLGDDLGFRKLYVNGVDMMNADLAAIRFYPNGTSDGMEAELQYRRIEARRLSLEIITGQLTVEAIP